MAPALYASSTSARLARDRYANSNAASEQRDYMRTLARVKIAHNSGMTAASYIRGAINSLIETETDHFYDRVY